VVAAVVLGVLAAVAVVQGRDEEGATTPGARPGATSVLRAFPTAEGYGQHAVGGRGGRVVAVTTLADDGPGSLRAALETSGRRMVVFRVAGTIVLRERILVDDPYLTVAGQTAPGDGVQVRNHPDSDDEAVRIQTHDVVVRHLRIRPGPTRAPTCCAGGVTLSKGAHDVVLDHVSLMWGVDENLSSGDGAHDWTLQWSIVAHGLDDASHKEGPHSMGVLLGSWTEDHALDSHRNVSIHHTLFAHNDRRSPRMTNAGRVVLANNVVHGWRGAGIQVGDQSGVRVAVAVLGNRLVPGPEGDPATALEVEATRTPTPGFALYLRDNVVAGRDDGLRGLLPADQRGWLVDTPPFDWPPIDVTSPAAATPRVLREAGATRPVRDRVDRAVVASVRDGGGGLIDDPSEVGGWPDLATGVPYPDDDVDGIDDRWERRHGLDPTDADDGRRRASSGYTWVEVFLNTLAGDPA
jgi:pectate lyase